MSKQSRHARMAVDTSLPAEKVRRPVHEANRSRHGLLAAAGAVLALAALTACESGGQGSPSASASSAEACQGLTTHSVIGSGLRKLSSGVKALLVLKTGATPLCLYYTTDNGHRLAGEGAAIDGTTAGNTFLDMTCEKTYVDEEGHKKTFAAISVVTVGQAGVVGFIQVPTPAVQPGGDLHKIPTACTMPLLTELPLTRSP